VTLSNIEDSAQVIDMAKENDRVNAESKFEGFKI
jgi:hypothetical protein